MNRATAVCYEPDPDNFALLSLNVPHFERRNVAVTAKEAAAVPFWKGRSPASRWSDRRISMRPT
jgi:hypothetical protein